MHSKYKVCLVAHLADLSGANKSLIDLCTEYTKIGIDFIVAIPRKGLLSNKLDELGIKYKIMHYTTWIDKKNAYLKRYIKGLINFISQFAFVAYCIKEEITIVHYNSISVGVGTRLLNLCSIPYVWHIREYIDNDCMVFHSTKKTFSCLKKASCLIAVSESIQEQYRDTLNDAEWIVVKNGIKIPIMHNYTREQYKNIIMVGGVEKNKGQMFAINVIAKLKWIKNVKLYIVGPINDREYYEQILVIVEKYKLQNMVFFVGYQENVDFYRKKCAIALVCSEYESFGRVTVEAMANGEVVIGANTGGTAELIRDGYNGLLYSYDDQNSLEKILKEVILCPEQYIGIIQEGRKNVIERYEIKKVAEEIIKIYIRYTLV